MSLSGAQVTRLWPYGGPGHNYGSFAGKAASPPVFAGTIPNISHTENTGTHSYDLGAYFTGATSYSIAPAVEAGWTFDTVTGELEIDTDAVGVFGTYVVTGTNVTGSDDSNAFSVTVVAVAADQPSGGWLFLHTYESELQRRRTEARKRRELEEETEQIDAPVDREIAQLLRIQEAKDAKRQELRRLSEIARASADLEAARRYSAGVAEAYAKALETGSRRALIALDRELQKARSEEDFLLMAMLLLSE